MFLAVTIGFVVLLLACLADAGLTHWRLRRQHEGTSSGEDGEGTPGVEP